jgi:hypothetical protein
VGDIDSGEEDAIRILSEAGGQDFDGDVTFQARVAGEVDLPHPSRTQRRGDFERSEAIATLERHAARLIQWSSVP